MNLPSWWDLRMFQRFWFALGVDAVDRDADAEETYERYRESLSREEPTS
jgi:hypothetical protein